MTPAALTLAAALLVGEQTTPQPPCGQFAAIREHIEQRYGERAIGHGFHGPAAVQPHLWMFANAGTGTWSALMVRGDGLACIVGAGGGWKFELQGSDT